MSKDNCDIDEVIAEFGDLPLEVPEGRKQCNRCQRPIKVCLCEYLPHKPIQTESELLILQHPNEQKRNLRTAPILEVSLADKCTVIRSKKFSTAKHQKLAEFISDKKPAYLLYPSPKSTPLDNLPPQPARIVILDGTWAQARSMYNSSPDLKLLTKVILNVNQRSNYIIRTQPTEDSLSTVESAAITLSHFENNSSIYESLMKPLKALCTFQIEHGAVDHMSKEYLILHGLYHKPIARKLQKKLGNKEDMKFYIRRCL